MQKKTGMTKDDYVGAYEIVLGGAIIRYKASTLRNICRTDTLNHDTFSRMASDALAYFEYGECLSLSCYKNHNDANVEYGLSLLRYQGRVMIFGNEGETLADYSSNDYPFLTDWYWHITPSARQKVTELMNARNWDSSYWTIFLEADNVWPVLFERYYGTGEYQYHNG